MNKSDFTPEERMRREIAISRTRTDRIERELMSKGGRPMDHANLRTRRHYTDADRGWDYENQARSWYSGETYTRFESKAERLTREAKDPGMYGYRGEVVARCVMCGREQPEHRMAWDSRLRPSDPMYRRLQCDECLPQYAPEGKRILSHVRFFVPWRWPEGQARPLPHRVRVMKYGDETAATTSAVQSAATTPPPQTPVVATTQYGVLPANTGETHGGTIHSTPVTEAEKNVEKLVAGWDRAARETGSGHPASDPDLHYHIYGVVEKDARTGDVETVCYGTFRDAVDAVDYENERYTANGDATLYTDECRLSRCNLIQHEASDAFLGMPAKVVGEDEDDGNMIDAWDDDAEQTGTAAEEIEHIIGRALAVRKADEEQEEGYQAYLCN